MNEPPQASPLLPPWLVVYVAANVVSGIPGQARLLNSALAHYQGQLVPYLTLIMIALVAGAPNAVLACSVSASMLFPKRRGRWIERRYGLAQAETQAFYDMQEFIYAHNPSVSFDLRLASRGGGGQLARVYPVDLSSGRIAVFPRLMRLWESDRQAAEVILLHELAHQRQGDTLIVGLGTPFPRLIRIWAAAFAVLLLVLATYLIFGSGHAPAYISGQAILQIVQAPTALILPVTGLWLAELGADWLAAREAGRAALAHTLQHAIAPAPGAEPATARRTLRAAARWVTGLSWASHPPYRLRTRMAQAPDAPALLIAWPVAIAIQIAVTIAAAVPGYLLTGVPAGAIARDLGANFHQLLLANRLFLIVVTFLLLSWPFYAEDWQRKWSAICSPSLPGPWGLYLATAALPVMFALLTFLPS